MLASILERHAAERPAERAVVTEERALGWRELKERVDRLAGGLHARGVEPGERVALLLPNCPAFVVGFLAAARLGAVAVPLSTDAKPREVREAVDAAGCTTLLADDRFAALCHDLLREGALLRAFLRDGDAPETPSLRSVVGESPGAPGLGLPPESADALEQFTSGTTGPPKRVLRSHAQLANEAAAFAAATGTSAADRILAVVPLSHAHGLGNALLASLHAGATLVLQERFDRRAVLRALSRERITLFPTVPFIVSILAETRMLEPIDLGALRLCFSAGSALRRETWCKARERLGVDVRQLYGSTETGALALNLGDASAFESVGRPLPGVELAVLDEAGAKLPPDAEGEVVARSAAAAEWCVGPLGKAPLAGADGWIRMGDLGSLDAQGRLALAGRKALVIHVAGRKVNPGEVESILLDHPKVRDAVVLGVRGPGAEEAVKAVVVSREACALDELLAHCRERLADYKVPGIVEFRDAIPRCPAGKVLRSQLLESTCAS